MFLVYVRPQTLLAEIEDALVEPRAHAVSCGFSTFACTDCTDDVENRSDKSWLCNNRSSRAMNACTRTTHRLTGKVSTNTEKFRLAFNQISLSEPSIQPWEVRDADGFEKVFAALNKQRPDGLYA